MTQRFYPKFEERLKDKVLAPESRRMAQPGYGIVLAYDPMQHSATVLAAQPGSDLPGEIYANVPCPVTPGIQGVAPEIGRFCWLAFRSPTTPTPMITHFFSMSYEEKDERDQNIVHNKIPRFMSEM